MPTLDPVILEVKSPAPKGLPGLDLAANKLLALQARLQQINAFLAKPAEIRVGFKDWRAAESGIRQAATRMQRDLKSFKPVDIAELFKWDPGRFQEFVANAQREIARHMGKTKSGAQRSPFTTTGEFANMRAASAATAMFSREVARESAMPISEFLRKAWEPIATAPTISPAAATGAVKAATQATQAATQATTAASLATQVAAQIAGGAGSGGGRGASGATTPFGGPPRGSRLLSIKEVIPHDATRDMTIIRNYLTSVGKTLRTYSTRAQTGGAEEPQKQERLASRVTPAVRDLRSAMTDAQRQLLEMQASAQVTPQALSGLFRQMSTKLESASQAIRAEGLGQESEADKALIRARALNVRAKTLEDMATRQGARRASEEARGAIQAAKTQRARGIARGDVSERIRLAQDLEDVLSRQAGALSPREVDRVRAQVGRLRGSVERVSGSPGRGAALQQRADALDAIAKADADVAAAMQRGGIDAAGAREQAAAARKTLLESPAAAALTPRQRYRMQGQAARLQEQAQASLSRAADQEAGRARTLENEAARQAARRATEEARGAIQAAKTQRAGGIAGGDVAERLRLAQDLEDVLNRQAGALSPREVSRVRAQVGRLRGSGAARFVLQQRAEALDMIAKADAEVAGAMQRGGVDAAGAREQAAAARKTLLGSPAAAALTPRQRYRLQGQQARLQEQAQAGLNRAATADVQKQLAQADQEAKAAMGSLKGRRVVRSAEPLRRILAASGDQLDTLERTHWERRIGEIEGNAAAARRAYQREDRRDAGRSAKGRSTIEQQQIKAADRRRKAEEEMAEFEERRRQRTHSVGDAQRLIEAEQTAGARVSRRETVRRGGRDVGHMITTERETEGGLRRVSAVFTEAGANVRTFERGLKATRTELGAAGRDFFRNTMTVTAWAASVATLYGGLAVLRRGLTAFREVDLAMARLSAVYRGNSEDVRGLVDDVLRLASAEGRTSQEALDSAIRWARVGYTRLQIADAVAVSLQAANVAEITAAEATERLMGVTAAYSLRARDLNDLLGMLNQTSNTWNASNAEMLNGLTRTASVAKQAGLPLAELIGIMGAAIGTTGQSGANIGNAIKSVLVRLGSPELQDKLRMAFNFEVMGMDDIAEASDILRELFVAYQGYNHQMRQSLLYYVAGRTQASRMTAILDSYVRAQVLAINAQLHLNSAEEENIRIRASLHNQLQGLITEFERFTSLQMATGPVGMALKTAAETLRNVFKLGSELTRSGGGAGAWVQHGMMGLTGLIGARMALTGLQASPSAGMVGRTAARVAGAGAAMSAALDLATESFMTRRWGARQRLGAQTVTGALVGKIRGGEDWAKGVGGRAGERASASLLALQGQMKGVERMSTLAGIAGNRGLQGMARAARFAMMSVRGLVIALRTMFTTVILPLAAIAAGVFLFNRYMRSVGGSVDHVTARLRLLEQQADQAGAASRAAQQGIQLTKTVERTLLQNRDPQVRERMLKDLADAELFTDDTRTGLRAAASSDQDDVVRGLLEEERARLELMRVMKRAEQLGSEVKRREVAQAELTRLEALEAQGTIFGGDARRANMLELSNQLAQSEEKTLGIILDQEEALERNLQLRSAVAAAAGAMTGQAEAAGSVLGRLPVSGEAGRGLAEQAAIRAEIAQRKNMAEGLKEAEKATAFELAAKDEAVRLAQKKVDDLSTQLQAEQDRQEQIVRSQGATGGAAGPSMPLRSARAGELLRQVQEAEAALKAEQQRSTPRTTDVLSLQLENTKQQEEAEKRLVRSEAADRYRQVGDEWDLRSRMTRSDLGAAGYGTDDADRLNRRLSAARQLAADAQGQAYQAEAYGTPAEAGEHAVRWLTAQAEIMGLQEERQRTLNDLRRQEAQLIVDARKELERSLLSAGPGDMLRRVAAERLGRQGVGGAQFFAAAPEMRRDLAMLFPEQFNPEVAQVRRARGRLEGDADLQPQNMVEGLRENVAMQHQAMAIMSAAIGNMNLSDSALSAGENLSAVAVSANLAAVALASLPEAVRALVTGGDAGNALPQNTTPQSQGDRGTRPPPARRNRDQLFDR